MEALTAVSVAALTIYDMCKAVDKKMRITEIKLVSKTKLTGGNVERRENVETLNRKPGVRRLTARRFNQRA